MHARIGALPGQDAFEPARLVQAKDDNRQAVIACQGNGRGIHHVQMLGQNLIIGDAIIAFRIGVFHRVFVVYTIHLGAFKDSLAGHLVGAQRGGGIGGEIGVAGAGCENAHALFSRWRTARRRM